MSNIVPGLSVLWDLQDMVKTNEFFCNRLSVSSWCFGACPSIFSSTKGHLEKYRTRDLDLMSRDSLLQDSIKVSFRGRSMGGRSGDNETFLVWPRIFFVPVKHLSRWARSTKGRMILAFGLWLNRWQAARCQVAASSILRTSSCANWIHLVRVYVIVPRPDPRYHGL